MHNIIMNKWKSILIMWVMKKYSNLIEVTKNQIDNKIKMSKVKKNKKISYRIKNIMTMIVNKVKLKFRTFQILKKKLNNSSTNL